MINDYTKKFECFLQKAKNSDMYAGTQWHIKKEPVLT